jgi:hypothetical protein
METCPVSLNVKNNSGGSLVKKVLCCTALCAALILLVGSAVAQNPASVRSSGIASGRVVKSTTPKYCKPCLFYGGDWNDTATNWVAFGNADNPGVSDDFQNFSPFKVAAASSATGLFTNNLSTIGCTIDPKKALWSIHTGVKTGSGGKVVAHGTAAATFKATGRTDSGYDECTALVTIKAVALKAGTAYWEQVTPECTVTASCGSAYYYETDTFNTKGTGPGANKVGVAEPKDKSFAYSKINSYDYVNDDSEGYPDPGGSWMSAGVIGK